MTLLSGPDNPDQPGDPSDSLATLQQVQAEIAHIAKSEELRDAVSEMKALTAPWEDPPPILMAISCCTSPQSQLRSGWDRIGLER